MIKGREGQKMDYNNMITFRVKIMNYFVNENAPNNKTEFDV